MIRISYRVECNYGSKYFNTLLDATIYFNYCRERKFEVSLWRVQSDSIYSIQTRKAVYKPSIKHREFTAVRTP